jgi:hypothetical protein
VETKKVLVKPDYGGAGGFMNNTGLFGDTTTCAHTHAIILDSKEQDLVELCSRYFAILIQELASIEASITSAAPATCVGRPRGAAPLVLAGRADSAPE